MTNPNVELCVHIASEGLKNHETFKSKLRKIEREKNFRVAPDFVAEVFPQMWGSTCTGFDVAPDGSPMWGGSAMTEEYTTVVHECITDTYVIFFGNRPCYMVANATDVFFEDLKNRQLKSLSQAKTAY